MRLADIFKQYLEHLFGGKRCEARDLLLSAQDRGVKASKLLKMVVWPAMEEVDKLYRANRINRIVEHMATRINRMVADQLQCLLASEPKNGKRIVVVCGRGEAEELGAQITSDLLQAHGYHVWFLGSGVPNDEVLQFIGKIMPDVLCIYGALPEEVPEIRKLITLIREVGVCEDMQVLVSGGVFNRADGLAEEIKADLFGKDIDAAVKAVESNPVRVPQPDVPQPGRRRKRKRQNIPAGMRKLAESLKN